MVKLSKVKRELVLDFGDEEKIIVGVHKLDPALSIKLGEKQRLIGALQKELMKVSDSQVDDIEKGIEANKALISIREIYIDIFKLCVVDYSIIESSIENIPLTATDLMVEIMNEINKEMTKIENSTGEKKN